LLVCLLLLDNPLKAHDFWFLTWSTLHFNQHILHKFQYCFNPVSIKWRFAHQKFRTITLMACRSSLSRQVSSTNRNTGGWFCALYITATHTYSYCESTIHISKHWPTVVQTTVTFATENNTKAVYLGVITEKKNIHTLTSYPYGYYPISLINFSI